MVATIAAVCSLLTRVAMKLLSILIRSTGKRVELGEARIAGAEIVERNADADVLEALDDGQHLLAVLEQRAFGDLDLEPLRREAGAGEDRHDLLGQRGVAELGRARR